MFDIKKFFGFFLLALVGLFIIDVIMDLAQKQFSWSKILGQENILKLIGAGVLGGLIFSYKGKKEKSG